MKPVELLTGSLRAQLIALMAALGFVLTTSHVALRLSDFIDTRVRETNLMGSVIAQSLASAAWGATGSNGRAILLALAEEAREKLDILHIDAVKPSGEIAASTRSEREGRVLDIGALTFRATNVVLSPISLTGPMTYEVPAVLQGPKGPEGYLVLGFRSNAVATAVGDYVGTNLVVGLVWLGVLSLATIPLIRRVTEPLESLLHAVTAISKGTYDVELAPAVIREVSVLQHRFIGMTEALAQKDKENRALLESLQARVTDATRDLRKANCFLQSMIESLRDGIITMNDGGTITGLSARAAAILGHSLPGPSEGSPLADLLPETGRMRDAIDTVVRDRSSVSLELSDGQRRFLEVDLTPLLTDEAPGGVLARIADITERRRLEQQVRRAERLSTAGEIAAVFAHEFGNAMHVVLGHGKVLLEELPADAPIRADIRTMVDESERASALVQRFKLFATPSRGKLIDLELDSVTDDATHVLQPTMKKHGVRLHYDVAPDTPLISGDPALVRQAISNILLNAIQAMPNGGDLTVRVDRASEDRARVTIEDTGPGILAADLPRIFDPFFTTKPDGEGTGLGLSVVQTVMTLHGGSVDVENRKPLGTTFYLTFPSLSPRATEPPR